MRCIVRRLVVSSLIAILFFGTAAAPTSAASGKFGDCIQSCNLFHATCMDDSFAACESTYPRESVEFELCVEQFLGFCNFLAFDCKYNHCKTGLPEPLSVVPQEVEGPGTAPAS